MRCPSQVLFVCTYTVVVVVVVMVVLFIRYNSSMDTPIRHKSFP